MNKDFEKKAAPVLSEKKPVKGYVFSTLLWVLALVWTVPLFYLLVQSFRGESGAWSDTFFPKTWTLDNYRRLFFDSPFPRWYGNTLLVSVVSAAISTLFVLGVSYAFSRLRFAMRRPLMNLMLILGMFPGFMAMTAVYFLLKVILGEANYQSLASLIIVYSAGAGAGYYVQKGFFDTIPRSLDEAALIDGATRFQIFKQIMLPLSGPMIVYTVLVSFIAPWCDYIFVSFIMAGAEETKYTVALGMYRWLEREQIQTYFTTFCAAAVVVAVPITLLFLWLQRFYVQGVTGGAVKG